MSPDNEKHNSKASNQPDGHLSERLEKLGAQLDGHFEASDKKSNSKNGRGATSGLTQAWKISSEFVAGILVGAGIGWMADSWLGTKPWGLIIFLLLGFAAGVLNVLRSVGKVAEPERRMNSHAKQDPK